MEIQPAAQAVEELIRDYGKLVFHTIYGLTDDWDLSQDLTQETFLSALKAIDAAREASGPSFHARAWLLRIALNTVRMYRRRSALMQFVPFSQMQGDHEGQEVLDGDTVQEQAAPVQPAGYGASAPADPAVIVPERDAVQRALASLPNILRAPLLLSIIGGCSPVEMATILGIREDAARQRLSRARKAFQASYAAESGEQVSNTRAGGKTRKRPGGNRHRLARVSSSVAL